MFLRSFKTNYFFSLKAMNFIKLLFVLDVDEDPIGKCFSKADVVLTRISFIRTYLIWI